MALSNRERNVSWILLGVGVLLALDQLALDPYLHSRAELVTQRQAINDKLEQSKNLLDTEKRDRQSLARIESLIKSDPAEAETQLLHLLHEWEQQSAVAGASFQRTHTAEEHGYTRLSFHVTANGSLPAIAAMIYRAETAPLPLRLDEVLISPRRDNGDDLQLQLTLSTLSRNHSPRPQEPSTQPTNSLEVAGGQQ